MTMHEEWTEKLSDYLDGELPDREARDVAAHLEQCAECSRTLDELRAVVAAAQALEPGEPARDLWAGIADRVASTEGARPVVLSGPWPRISFTLPQLAAASILLALVSGWAAMRFVSTYERISPQVASAPVVGTTSPLPDDVAPASISFNDTEYDAAVADLERALQSGRDRLDSTTVKVVEDNLAIIDQAVSEARQALAEDPGNGYLSGYFLDTRRRKLDLLRRAAALTENLN